MNMNIPFSPPHIDDAIIAEVVAVLRSGWITTGPKTRQFEQMIADYVGIHDVVCVNSASAGLELALRWFGIGEGDEVIVPAYTYTATAEVVLHCGARPVLVDVNDDFLIDPEKVRKAITPRTKAILPVDIVGLPCDYKELFEIVNDTNIQKMFQPSNELQKSLGRILILADAAHSLGASYLGRKIGAWADITVFSFHAVKNLTTAEGGAICLHLPDSFYERQGTSSQDIKNELKVKSLHGQSKDAFAKTKAGGWRYDVVNAGYKCNMTDVAAAMGVVELARYDEMILPRRKQIFDAYNQAFANDKRFRVPTYENAEKTSSYHVYTLRINQISETNRDNIIQKLADQGIATNVHFIPLPMLTVYKSLNYKIEDYPNAYRQYACEISLPVYYDLTDEQVQTVIRAMKEAVSEIRPL